MTHGLPTVTINGGGDNLEIVRCQNNNPICDAIISVDTSQIPPTVIQSIHSIVLNLFVESWDLTEAYQVEFSIHEFLYANWDETPTE